MFKQINYIIETNHFLYETTNLKYKNMGTLWNMRYKLKRINIKNMKT
jgi:hypothetical protein